MMFLLNHAKFCCWLSLGALLAACSFGPQRAQNDEYLTYEAWDGRNAPQIFGQLRSLPYDLISQDDFLSGQMPHKPWSDDYWPLQRAGTAWRWMQPGYELSLSLEVEDYGAQVLALIDQKKHSADDYLRTHRSSFLAPSEKYDYLRTALYGDEVAFPFTRKELLDFGRNYYTYETAEIPWGWMGHCHGWAAATLIEETPKHPVYAQTRYGGMTFSVGDVRALLTRAYSENLKDGQELFLGDRCNRQSDDLVRDSKNRVVDGVLGEWQDEQFVANHAIHFVYNNWRLHGHTEMHRFDNMVVFRYADSEDQELYWARAIAWTDQRHEIARVDVGHFDPNRPFELGNPIASHDFRYLKACRDINAGAFHVALARLLSHAAAQENMGNPVNFVVDIDNGLEVWNQPLYSFRSKIGPLTSLDGENRDLDPFAAFRAEDARYIAHVVTEISFGVENGPKIVYADHDDAIASLIYQYTLELNADQQVIGGEWLPPTFGSFAARQVFGDEELFSYLGIMINVATWQPPKHPDFIWRYTEGTQITSNCRQEPCLDVGLIHQLAACSRGEPDTEQNIGGHAFPAVTCDIH